ncbi:MAG: hypothetical protein JWM93_346 [Frankiales bacterium]|nr:hypothetical protein [Frankiales bacterium]
MAGRLTSGGLGWRKAGAAPVVPAATPAAAPAAVGAPAAGPHAGLDHTEALERWASTAHERPSWLADPARDAAPETSPAAAPPVGYAPTPEPVAASEEPVAPSFDDATDRFALFAMRAAEARGLFAAAPAAPAAAATASADADPARVSPGFSRGPAWARELPATADPASAQVTTTRDAAPVTTGWRPDDVQVSTAETDADAMRLEMLAERAAELRASRRDFDGPLASQSQARDLIDPAATRASGWRRDMVEVSAEAFDADAARLEMLAARAAEFRPEVDPESAAATAEVDDAEAENAHVAFWRKDVAVVTAAEFDADTARLETLAARGPLVSATDPEPRVEATPFWEMQERARRDAEEKAAAEVAAREAVAADEWHTRFERMAADAARRGAAADPFAG